MTGLPHIFPEAKDPNGEIRATEGQLGAEEGLSGKK